METRNSAKLLPFSTDHTKKEQAIDRLRVTSGFFLVESFSVAILQDLVVERVFLVVSYGIKKLS